MTNELVQKALKIIEGDLIRLKGSFSALSALKALEEELLKSPNKECCSLCGAPVGEGCNNSMCPV